MIKLIKIFYCLIFTSLLSLSAVAADKKNVFEGVPVSNGYGFQISGFHHIEPEFVAECLKKPGQHILEVGAAEGRTMIKVLNNVIRACVIKAKLNCFFARNVNPLNIA